MVKEGRIALRIDADLKKEAAKFAEADRRSLSVWIELLIEEAVKRRTGGMLPRTTKRGVKLP